MAPGKPHWSAIYEAKCVLTICHENPFKGDWPTKNVTYGACPDDGKFYQFGCDLSGNPLDISGKSVHHLTARDLTAHAFNFTVKVLKHGDKKGWIVPLILVGVICTLILLLFFYLMVEARKTVVAERRQKMTAEDVMSTEEGKNKEIGVQVVEEEYANFN